jgi:hypothetical protein
VFDCICFVSVCELDDCLSELFVSVCELFHCWVNYLYGFVNYLIVYVNVPVSMRRMNLRFLLLIHYADEASFVGIE